MTLVSERDGMHVCLILQLLKREKNDFSARIQGTLMFQEQKMKTKLQTKHRYTREERLLSSPRRVKTLTSRENLLHGNFKPILC
jgi:hypothetical protein